jgi:ABC-type transport system substrate-binding protein
MSVTTKVQSHRARVRIIVPIVIAGLAVAGCSSNSSGSGSQSQSKSIVISATIPPQSLDPAKNGNNPDQQMYMDLAYDPLVVLKPDGSLGPGLATSWKFTDKALTTFEMKLRQGVKFSDGKALTAAAVVASIEYQKGADGPGAGYASTIKSAQAVGPLTVRLNLTQANPDIAFMLTQRFEVGDIIGPTALSNPSKLGTSTDGAGPYMLDVSKTTSNDHYTYVPNPYYWNKPAVHFSSFTVRVIANPQSNLNALKSGQVSFATGDFSTAGNAKSSGIAVHAVPASFYGVFLYDRNGALVPALKSQLVRQALNYATDRQGITKALFGDYGVPADEISLPGSDGYDPSYVNHYPYDPAKAKQLLAQAGYPHGFDITIGASPVLGSGLQTAQAVTSDWAKIGVKVKIQSYPDINSLVADWGAKKLPAVAQVYDGAPMYVEANQILVPSAGLFNVFGSTDKQLDSAMTKALTSTNVSSLAGQWRAVQRRVVDLGWFDSIAYGDAIYYSDPKLQGIALSSTTFAPNPVLWHF